MIDTIIPITQFIRTNFTPVTTDSAEYKYTSEDFLKLLFTVFPQDSIDSYDLYQILIGLDFKPQKGTEDGEIKIFWAFNNLQ